MSTQTDTVEQIEGGELESTTHLRAEAEVTVRLIEEAGVLGDLLKTWQSGLHDAYVNGHASGGPQTAALTEAVDAVAEAGDDGQALGEALSAIRQACDQADSFGELAGATGATGHTKGFRPA